MPRTAAQKAHRKAKNAASPKKKQNSMPQKAARRKVPRAKHSSVVTTTVKGGGDYKSSSKSGSWAAKLGGLGGDLIDHIFGTGDYHDSVCVNSLMDKGGPPQFANNSKSRATRVLHREFVQDVIGSTAFTNTVYPIAITNSTLFPWLSAVASNYEQWRIHGMLFEFRSTSGVLSTTQALGAVVMATQYDALDNPFVNKQQMENYEYSNSCAPCSNILHGLECMRNLVAAPILDTALSERPGVVSDIRLSQFGVFNLATVGQTNAVTIGELWVTYDIELLKPRISALASALPFNMVCFEATYNTTTCSNAVPFGPTGTMVVSAALAPVVASEPSAVLSSFLNVTNNTVPLPNAAAPCFSTNSANFAIPAVFAGRTIALVMSFVGTGFSGSTVISVVSGGATVQNQITSTITATAYSGMSSIQLPIINPTQTGANFYFTFAPMTLSTWTLANYYFFVIG